MSARRVRWLLTLLLLAPGLTAMGEPPRRGEEPERKDPFGDPLPKGAVSRMGTVRLRHEQPVAFLAVSPDGKVLASAGQGFTGSGDVTFKRSIFLWDLTTGKELRRLGRRAVGGHMAFSPDGKLLASAGCEDATVHVWNVLTGEELYVLIKHHEGPQAGRNGGYASGVAFSPDGRVLATSGGDGMIRLWDVASGDEIDEWKAEGRPDVIAFSSDGKRLAGVSGASLVVWDALSGKPLSTFPGLLGSTATGILFLNDGKTIVSSNSDLVAWHNLATGKVDHQIRGVLMPPPPGGKEFVVHDGKEAHVYDMASGKEVRALALPPGRWYSGVLTSDGKTLVAAEWQHVRIRAWETQKGKELFPQEAHSAPVVFVGFSPDGKELITAGDSAARFWDVATGKELRQLLGHKERISEAAMSADGKTLASGSTDGTVRLWDLAARKELRQFKVERAGDRAVALSANGRRLAWSWFAGAIVRQWDVQTGEEFSPLKTGSSTYALTFDPCGKSLIRLGGPTLEQWDCATAKRVGVYEGTPKKGGGWPASAIARSPDGRMMAAGHSDGKREPWIIGLWETASRKLISRFYGHDGPMGVVAFSADGKLLASGGWDKTVRLWDIGSGRELARFEGHRWRILSLAFSPDGKELASGSTDGTALVWDIAAYRAPRVLQGQALKRDEVDALWDDLHATDAAKAFVAVQKLATVPKQSVPLLQEKLSLGLGEREIPRLIADLDSEKFDVRETAFAELERLGNSVERPLREALSGHPSAEVRDRATRLLQKVRSHEDRQLSGEQLREIRSVQVLEMIGTPEARAVLQKLADKGSKDGLRDEAAAALARMSAAKRN